MNKRIIAAVGVIILAVGFIVSLAMFFMKMGFLWELKLFELPLVLGMVSFFWASFLYEDTMRDLFPNLEIQRFGALAAATIGAIGLVAKLI